MICTAGRTSADDLGTGWSSLTHTAHRLLFRIQNNTWTQSYEFPPVVNGVWRHKFTLENLTLSSAGINHNLITDWMYVVELDTGMYRSYGSIILIDSQVRALDTVFAFSYISSGV